MADEAQAVDCRAGRPCEEQGDAAIANTGDSP